MEYLKIGPRLTQQGVTLFELMFALGIIAIVLALSVPSLRTLYLSLTHRSIALAADAFIQDQRHRAIYTHEDLLISVTEDGTCLGAAYGKVCDCKLPKDCNIDGELATFQIDGKQFLLNNLRLAQPDHFGFQSRLGTSMGLNGSFSIHSEVAETRLIISGLGRTRICTKQGTLPGVEAC